MTWFPNVKDEEMPWLVFFIPTEPLLAPTRKVIPPFGHAPQQRHAPLLSVPTSSPRPPASLPAS